MKKRHIAGEFGEQFTRDGEAVRVRVVIDGQSYSQKYNENSKEFESYGMTAGSLRKLYELENKAPLEAFASYLFGCFRSRAASLGIGRKGRGRKAYFAEDRYEVRSDWLLEELSNARPARLTVWQEETESPIERVMFALDGIMAELREQSRYLGAICDALSAFDSKEVDNG